MKVAKKHLLNYSILIPYFILSILGLLVVYSSTSADLIYKGGNPFKDVISQFAFWILSLFVIWFVYRLKLSFLRNVHTMTLVMLIELFLLVVALFFAPKINGARGWIQIGSFFSFQPAEYLKLIVVWFLSLTFARRQKLIATYDFKALTKGTWFPRQFKDWRVYLAIMLVLVILQPDLGNATIVILTAIIMFSISGIAYRWFTVCLLGTMVGGVGLTLLVLLLGVERFSNVPVFGYVAKRFSAFFNPFEDLSNAGHQLAHSYYAMVNGGWFGRGLGNSIEKNGYLPEAHTDFVFSIVIEEFGLIGAGLILALVFFLILRIMNVGLKAKDTFNSLLALGIGAMLLVQVFVNIGGISGLIPSTGVTFPFLSKGGNSLLILSSSIAVVLNIDANEKRAELSRLG